MRQKFKRNKTFDKSKGATNEKPRISEIVDVFEFQSKEWAQMRFVGPLASYGYHWVETKKKDGSKANFPKLCLAYDPETEERDSTKMKHCPWCKDDPRIRFNPEFYGNAIIRAIEEDGPGKKNTDPTKEESKTGFKTKGTKTWTPVRAVRLTGNNVATIKTLGGLNRHKSKSGEKKAYDVSHPKFGCDVSIMYDPDQKVAAKKYTIQKGDSSPITEEQEEYLLHQIEDMITPDSKEEANREYQRWLEKMGQPKKAKGEDDDDDSDDDDDDDDEDEDDDGPESKQSKSKKSDKKSKKSKKSDDDDEDDEDDEDSSDDDDEDEDEKPKKKDKKAKSKKSKKDDDDDEDDLDDDDELDDDDDDDEDEKPKKKGKADKTGKKSKSKKSKKSDDDDEDDDEDEDDDD